MLAKAYAASALPILVKAFIGIFLLRIFTEQLGKEGLGQVSQFQGIALIVYGILNAVFFNHIAQSYWRKSEQASSQQNNLQFRKLLGIIILISSLAAVMLSAFASNISIYLFTDDRAVSAIFLLAITCPVTGLFVAYSAYVCASGALIAYNISNAIALLLSGLLIYILIIFWGRQGAYFGLSLYYLFPFLCVVLVAYSNEKQVENLLPAFNGLKSYPIHLVLKFGLFGAFSALNSIAIQVFLRHQLSLSTEWTTVGDWQAITKISESYLLLVTTPLNTFILPQLSMLKIKQSQNALIKKTLLMGVIFTLCFGILLFSLWDSIIIKIIGMPFADLKKFIPIQVFGDIFKVICWTLVIVALARMQFKLVFVFEVIFTIIYVLTALYWIPLFKLQGAIMAYTFAYGLSALFLLIVYFRLKDD